MLWIIITLLFKANIHGIQGQNDFREKFEKLKKDCLRDQTNRMTAKRYSEEKTCGVDFYGACWPETLANVTVYLPCPSLFFDPLFGNISRRCNGSGGWEKTNISFCVKLKTVSSSSEEEDVKLRIYVVLSWFSISVMIPSLIVTVYLLKGKNERFNVHTNLILAFTFRITTFFIHHYENLGSSDSSRVYCNLVWILNRYFASAEIMWMLNEALLLLRKVVIIFNKRSYFKYYLLIGWGSPVVFLTVYIPTMVYEVDLPPKRCWTHYKDSMYMLVLYVPLVLILIIDFIALIYTVTIFVRRQRVQQKGDLIKIRKAIKGTLVLSPLLGVIYLLIFFVPPNPPVWYQYFLRIAYPMQGTLACLVYITFSNELLNKAKSKYKLSIQGTRILENGKIFSAFSLNSYIVESGGMMPPLQADWLTSYRIVFRPIRSGYSRSYSSRSRNTDRTMKGKTDDPSPDPSIDPSGLSHSSPPCDNGPKCGCPDASVFLRTEQTSDDDEEENCF